MDQVVLLTKQSIRLVPTGQYPISLSGSTNALAAPTNQGACTLDVKVSGAVHVKGTLGDGTKYSFNTMLCNSDIPFYTTLYGGKGAILGWISVGGGFRLPPPNGGFGFPPPDGGGPLTNIIITVPRQTNPVVIGPLPPVIVPILIGPGDTNSTVVFPLTNTPIRIFPVGANPPVIITNTPIKILSQRSTEAERQLIGTLNWFKPAGIDPEYPDGFSVQTTATGTITLP